MNFVVKVGLYKAFFKVLRKITYKKHKKIIFLSDSFCRKLKLLPYQKKKFKI